MVSLRDDELGVARRRERVGGRERRAQRALPLRGPAPPARPARARSATSVSVVSLGTSRARISPNTLLHMAARRMATPAAIQL